MSSGVGSEVRVDVATSDSFDDSLGPGVPLELSVRRKLLVLLSTAGGAQTEQTALRWQTMTRRLGQLCATV